MITFIASIIMKVKDTWKRSKASVENTVVPWGTEKVKVFYHWLRDKVIPKFVSSCQRVWAKKVLRYSLPGLFLFCV